MRENTPPDQLPPLKCAGCQGPHAASDSNCPARRSAIQAHRCKFTDTAFYFPTQSPHETAIPSPHSTLVLNGDRAPPLGSPRTGSQRGLRCQSKSLRCLHGNKKPLKPSVSSIKYTTKCLCHMHWLRVLSYFSYNYWYFTNNTFFIFLLLLHCRSLMDSYGLFPTI